jgi:hypothetical protein
MDEDEAALLAELRAISSQSSSMSRFSAEADDGGVECVINEIYDETTESRQSSVAVQRVRENEDVEDVVVSVAAKPPPANNPAGSPTSPRRKSRASAANLPPWKLGRSPKPKTLDENAGPTEESSQLVEPVSTTATTVGGGGGIRSNLPSTFTGERGGTAEDEELLAELRAISSKSSSADRFAGGEDDDEPVPTAEPPKPKPKQRDDAALPPWKRGRPKQQAKEVDVEVDVVFAAPPAPAPAPAPTETPGFGIKSNLPSTFTGERGGTAEDEDLLAELRAISSKSSSADRFAGGDNDDGDDDVVPVVAAPVTEPPKSKQRDDAALPPWKRGRPKQQAKEEEVDVVIAVPPAPAPAPSPADTPGFGIKSNLPSTFTGERGGTAEDEELLAELRAISSKSSSADRFAGGDNEDDDVAPAVAAPVTEPPKSKQRDDAALPPWKRGRPKQQAKEEEGDVVIAAPPVPAPAPSPAETPGFGIKSDLPSTFTGERGGTAEDEELLAELRAISSKSSSADRFAGGDNNDDDGVAPVVAAPVTEPPKSKQRDDAALPPWKRGQTKQQQQAKEEEDDVVIAAPPAPVPAPTETPGFGIKSDLPSTFTGERGGTAEDEELLAELRAISSKSSSVDRFAGGDGDDDVAPVVAAPVTEPPKPKPKQRDDAALPPWKRGRPKQQAKEEELDVVIAAPPAPAPAPSPAETPGFGIKSDLPSTFTGERGGTAEDEELLAELRAISSKSSSADRFAGGDNDDEPAPTVEPPKPKPKQRGDAALPPWKRGRPKQQPQRKEEEVDVVIAAPPAPASTETAAFGIKSDLPSTFTGERGGTAEDEELLAELRAISSKSSSSNRFTQDPDVVPGDSSEKVSVPPGRIAEPVKPRVVQKVASSGSGKATILQTQQQPQDSQEELTRADLPAALTDKNWKTRSSAYELLGNILLDMAQGAEPTGELSANSIVEGLDELLPTLVEDTNAGALDKALQFALLYAGHCETAGTAEQANKIVVALIKKNAFSSRPATLKLASSLTIKLMEVGSAGTASVHSVVEALLKEGLASKKPKVVQAASSLVLETACEFGAACLPLALIISSIPKMLVHSNANVRDCGVNIVAEVCRTLRSKAPLQDVVDGMKKAQVTELDSLLSKQPEPTPVRRGLRNQKKVAGSTSSSPQDALAALEAGTKELEAQRFASRPAVNLPGKVATSEFSSKIELQKWSEKVAALKIVLVCGGEKPYKLVPPSSNANYAPLISEMKKLLSHTHFAVVSNAMEVLSMLAEGVGEKLYPYLRPLLTTLLLLSKDKKLTRGVASCLDAMFGNILGFDHLLETDDALHSALDERTQKNALARASALEFLCRCVKRANAAGPRSHLSLQSAIGIGALCVSKLDDSDAAARKAALEAIRMLQGLDDPESVEAVRKIVYELKSTNTRAFKALSKATQAEGTASSRDQVTNKPTQPKARAEGTTSSRGQVATKPTSGGASEPSKTQKSRQATAGKGSYAGSSPETKEVKSSARDSTIPKIDDALVLVASLRVPQWDAPEDDGGILSGLEGKFA